MLTRLQIRNLAVVEDVTLAFGEGLNVLTGSTGAGKSLILGAVNLLLGERASPRAIRAGQDKAVVEATFRLGTGLADALAAAGAGGEIVIRREISRSGRSTAQLNGRSCTIKQLQAVSHQLVEPHGQNEQLRLRDVENHIVYLDNFRDNSLLTAQYENSLEVFRLADRALQSFEERMRVLAEKAELLEHRIDELDRAAIAEGEKDQLEQQVRLLESSQDIFEALNQVCELSEEGDAAASTLVGQGLRALERVRALDERFDTFAEQLRAAEITLKETAADMRRYLDGLEFEPERLQEMQERLALITALERRYHKPVDDIIAEHAEWKRELDAIAFEDEERERLQAERAKALERVSESALALRVDRVEAARRLDEALTGELAELAMPGAVFRTDVGLELDPRGELVVEDESVALGPGGIDRVVFHVRTNPGESEGPLVEVASGGELSRIALALKKVVSTGREGSVLILDELDAGIGADLGDMVAAKLAALAQRYQIVCITHMPQIAARGTHHLVVRKQTARNRTFTTIDTVEGEARHEEIARMLGGEKGSGRRLELAREMLDTPRRRTRPARP